MLAWLVSVLCVSLCQIRLDFTPCCSSSSVPNGLRRSIMSSQWSSVEWNNNKNRTQFKWEQLFDPLMLSTLFLNLCDSDIVVCRVCRSPCLVEGGRLWVICSYLDRINLLLRCTGFTSYGIVSNRRRDENLLDCKILFLHVPSRSTAAILLFFHSTSCTCDAIFSLPSDSWDGKVNVLVLPCSRNLNRSHWRPRVEFHVVHRVLLCVERENWEIN